MSLLKLARAAKVNDDEDEDEVEKKKIRRIHIVDIEDLRRFLSKLIHQVRTGEVSCNKGRVMGYLGNTLLKLFQGQDLEKRLEEIEREIEEIEKGL